MRIIMPRYNALTYAIGYTLYTLWPIEDFNKKINAEKVLTTEWEELKQEINAAPIDAGLL